ncbi:MAG TPA: formylmethanofuran dehydrogenase subunit E family protein [Thermodesulfobacteriota bacterium]|nr:formylmethanofuran dehydrogenase subunit E family protein [Thermodesulfobacteriota bacterium]
MSTLIGLDSYQEFLEKVKAFHGFPAPGVILGGLMVDVALQQFPPKILFNALSETNKCLPDAIQLLTPCTTGNSWLRVCNFGRFALALYDKDTGQGVRVFLDPNKIESWLEIKIWYYKLKPKNEVDLEALLDSIQRGGKEICSFRQIQVRPSLLKKTKRGKRIICPQCREAYPDNGQGLCLACQGQSPYLMV